MSLGLHRRGFRALAVATAIAGVGAALTSGCKTAATTPPGPWPEDLTSGEPADFSNVHVLANVVQATPEQNDAVLVQPDRLVFPASAAGEVIKKWPVGAPVVGGRRQGASGNNAFGYLRKVKEVKVEGDSIVVLTEQATLLDVLDKSQIQASTDPRAAIPVNTTGMSPEEIAALFPDVEPGEGGSLEEANAAGNTAATPDAAGLGAQRVRSAQAQRWNPFATPRAPGLRPQQIDGDYSTINLWAEVDATATFNLPASDGEGSGSIKFLDGWTQSFSVSEGGKTATFDVRASATLKSSMYFKPRLKVYLDVDIGKKGPYLDELTANLSGPLNLKNTLDLDVSVTGRGVDLLDLPRFYDLLRAKLPIAKTPGKRLAKSRPMVGPSIGPVPTAYVASLWLDCSLSVPNSIAATATFNVDAPSIGGGVKYTDAKGWSYDNLMKPIKADGNIVVRSGGSVAFHCAVTPKISWLIGGVGGPTAAVRTSVRGTATGKPECDPKAKKSGPADLKSTLSVVGDATLQAEGTIDVLKLNYTIATISLFTYPKPAFNIFSRNDTFAGQGGGRCQSTCDDKQKNAGESDVDCGGAVCDGCAPGRTCASDADCRWGMCKPNGTCGGGPCDNGVKDGTETGVDCGGSCPTKCSEGATCTRDADCGSGICATGGYCVAYLCLDGRLNGSESDVDCPCIVPGGYALCADGRTCRSAADCQSNLCNLTTHTCAADACSDGVVSGNETDVDCGGSCSWKCATGASCKVAADCQNGICNQATKKCAANACGDGVKNNQETAVDCGGPTCAKCALNERCLAPSDCLSGICNAARGICGANACSDGVQSPGESGIDCGGPTCAKCSIGNSCTVNADCISANCNATTRRCVGSACEDGVKNNTETDLDCGGACDKCATGLACTTGADCRSGRCLNNTCASDRCKDLVRNGPESGTDCGATSGCNLLCAVGLGCTGDADCASGICNTTTGVCVGSRCFDGKLTAGEADVDCGGACSTKCAGGKACAGGGDCVSTYCNARTNRCANDHCDNGVRDFDETDEDCGGDLCRLAPLTKCGVNRLCTISADCQSDACRQNGTCAANQCSDGIRNSQETATDCGGPVCRATSPCATGQACLEAADCATSACHATTHLCVGSHCDDASRSGNETDVDCGGATCATKCGTGRGCAANADCASTFCDIRQTAPVCTTDHCADGQTDGGETGPDCGSVCPGRKCGTGQACSNDADCQTDYCTGGFCSALPPPSPSNGREWYARLKSPGVTVPSGRYRIAYAPHVSTHPRDDVTVWCDMSDAGIDNSGRGGWTLIGEHNSAIASNEYWPLIAGWFLGQNSANITYYPPEEFSALFTDYRKHDVQLMRVHWTEMRWASYYNGSRNYLSRAIPRSDIRLAPSNTVTPYPANLPVMDMLKGGWIIFGPQSTSGYYWCAGDNLFTDGAQLSGPYESFPVTGGVTPPPGCKNHTSLNIGYDFSESGFPNQGLTFSGANCPPLAGANQSYLNCYPASAPTPNLMTASFGGTQIYGSPTRTDVGVHAVWAY